MYGKMETHVCLLFIQDPSHRWNLICFASVICDGVNFI